MKQNDSFNLCLFSMSGIDDQCFHFELKFFGYVESMHNKLESPMKGDNLFDKT